MGTPLLDLSNSYNLAFIYFNYGVGGAAVGADSVYFWDDVEFGNSTVSIDLPTSRGISVAPNPVHSTLTITADHRIREVQLFNHLGQHIRTITADTPALDVNIHDLPSGVYSLRIRANRNWSVRKVIKA